MFSRARFVMFVIPALLMLGATRAAASCPPGTTAGPFCIDGSVPDAGVPTTLDPTGSNKELGPVNGSPTKIAVINTAAAPMLAFTNPNNQVDISQVFLQVKQATNQDQWLYFGWKRDSNTGSGFLSIEFQHNALSSSCDYTGVDFSNPNDPETQALIAACNPWQGRKTGDFIVLWDQQGNLLNPTFPDISKRVFTCAAGTPPTACTLGAPQALATAVATVSGDRFFGELAIDLTTDVFSGDTCESFANVIPGTVTGNSDTADYKDTVFSTFPPISNCGAAKVTKVTLDPAGNVVDLSGTFRYTLDRNDGSDIRFAPVVVPTGCTTPACAETLKLSTRTLTSGGTSETHINLKPGTNYRLAEDTSVMEDVFSFVSIVCQLKTGGTRYPTTGNGGNPFTPFSVVIGDETDCTITNQRVKTTPSPTTDPLAKVFLFDSVHITGISATATPVANVTFGLFDNNTCTTRTTGTSDVTVAISYSNNGTVGDANTLSGNGLQVFGFAGNTYYWKVTYAGDSLNNGFTTCGTGAIGNLESTTITITHTK
jgi:hypothetical protein